MEEVLRVEEQVEVLGGLSQEEALHPGRQAALLPLLPLLPLPPLPLLPVLPVRQAVVPHVLHRGVAAGRPGAVLDGPEDEEDGGMRDEGGGREEG